MNEKWLIVGLGNPGKEFSNTRHNAGFILLEEIFKEFDSGSVKSKFDGLLLETSFENVKCILLEPQTYMNNSGICVYRVARYFKIPLENIIVVCDDTNFTIGKIKIRQSGSSGGHKGVNSIIEAFNSDKFIRIKVGVNDKPSKSIDLKDWVISKFTNEELSGLKKCASDVEDSIKEIVNDNIQKAMNKYNRI